MRRAAILAVGFSVVWMAIAAGPARATSYTWDNGGGDMTWATAANWDVGGSNPGTPPTGTDTAVFTGTAAGSVTVAAATSAGNVQFLGAGYTLAGGSLLLGGTSPQISQTPAVTGTNTVSSGFGLQNPSGATLTVSASGGTLMLTGPMTGGSTFLTIGPGSGAVVLSNSANDFTGAVTVWGHLVSGASNVIPDIPSVCLATGGTWNLNGFYEKIGALQEAPRILVP